MHLNKYIMKTKFFTGAPADVEGEMNDFFSNFESFSIHNLELTTIGQNEICSCVCYDGKLKEKEEKRKK